MPVVVGILPASHGAWIRHQVHTVSLVRAFHFDLRVGIGLVRGQRCVSRRRVRGANAHLEQDLCRVRAAMHHRRCHRGRLCQRSRSQPRHHLAAVVRVHRIVPVPVGEFHSRLVHLHLHTAEPLIPRRVGRRIGERVVVRAVVDGLCYSLGQVVGVDECLAARVLCHGHHRLVLLRRLRQECILLRRRCGPTVGCDGRRCTAGKVQRRIHLHTAHIHRIYRDLRPRQQVVRRAHLFVVAHHGVVRVGLVHVGFHIQREPSGEPDHVLAPGNTHQISRQQIECVQSILLPHILLEGGLHRLETVDVVYNLLCDLPRYGHRRIQRVGERAIANRTAVEWIGQYLRCLRRPTLLHVQRGLQCVHVGGESLQHAQLRRQPENGNTRARRCVVQVIRQLLARHGLCRQRRVQVVQQQHVHRAIRRRRGPVGKQACG